MTATSIATEPCHPAPDTVPAPATSIAENWQPSTSNSTAIRAAANRANAQHSTGPRTEEGKARSAKNSFKHGLSLQRHVVLEHEDPAEFEQLRSEFAEIFAPQSPREHLALEDLAQCRWALRRFDEGEVMLLEYHYSRAASPNQDEDAQVTYGEAIGLSAIQGKGEPIHPAYPSLLLLQRYRSHWDRRYQRALAEFDRAQRARRQQAQEERHQAEAQRRAEIQAAAERRKEELHQLRLALAKEKLEAQKARSAKVRQKAKTEEFLDTLDKFMNAHPQA